MWNAKSWWGHLIANDKTICGRNPMKNALGCYLFVAFLFFFHLFHANFIWVHTCGHKYIYIIRYNFFL